MIKATFNKSEAVIVAGEPSLREVHAAAYGEMSAFLKLIHENPSAATSAIRSEDVEKARQYSSPSHAG